MRETLAAHFDSRQVSRVLYGAIIGLALVVALQAHPPGAVAVAGSLIATAIAVGLAELYSEIVGVETRTHERVGRQHVVELLDEIVAVAAGISFPAVFFLLAALGAMETDTAFTAAKWSGLGLIAAYGFAAARLTGDSVLRSLLRAALAALIGAFLIAAKALVH
ncbi:MAG TPA: hypothetical protein VGF21_05665 [Thermoleophilaceae bacterium]